MKPEQTCSLQQSKEVFSGHQQRTVFGENGGRELAENETRSSLIEKFSREWELPESEIEGFIEDVRGSIVHFAEPATSKRVSEMEAVRRVQAKFRQAFRHLISYQSSQKEVVELRMSTRAMALELGFVDEAGADNTSDLGKLCGVSKQTMLKCTDDFQTSLQLPPRPGQRDDAACEAMSDARLGQLEGVAA